MSGLIRRIVKNHEHTVRLLDCIDREVAGYREDADYQPKLGIIQEAMDYLYNYANTLHRPLKTSVIAQIRPLLSAPDSRAHIEQIESQQQQLCVLSEALFDRFNQVAAGQVIPVSVLLTDYQEYSHLQRQHIIMVQKWLIPAIRQHLTDQDLLRVETALKENPDPLFGVHVWDSYENLYQHIIKNSRSVEVA